MKLYFTRVVVRAVLLWREGLRVGACKQIPYLWAVDGTSSKSLSVTDPELNATATTYWTLNLA